MTTKELYDILICKSDLHSLPKLYDNSLIWHLYKNAYIHACCNGADSFIEIFGGDGFTGSLMRQRLDEDDMLNELCTLGKKGNMLALKKSLFGTSVFYSGPSEAFPLTDRRSLHFGKKKWDGGQLVYLEQKSISAE